VGVETDESLADARMLRARHLVAIPGREQFDQEVELVRGEAAAHGLHAGRAPGRDEADLRDAAQLVVVAQEGLQESPKALLVQRRIEVIFGRELHGF
jgi:hypothetical protein